MIPVKRIVDGYIGAFRTIGEVVVVAVLIGAAAVAVTAPLWALATRAPDAFALLTALLIGALVLSASVGKVRRAVRHYRSGREYVRRRLTPALKRAAVVAAIALLLYPILLLFASGHILLGVGSVIVYVVGVSVYVFGMRGT